LRDPHKVSPDVSFIISGMQSGGSQRVAMGLLDHWTQNGKAVQLVTMHEPDQDFFTVSPAIERIIIGVPEPDVGRWQAYYTLLRSMARMRRNARRNPPRAVLSFLTTTNVMVILALMGLPIRVVVSERNDLSRQDPGLAWRILRKLTYRWAAAVTANSSNAIHYMKDYVPQQKLAMVPNPVAFPAIAATPSESNLILSVGRLVPQKGHTTIVSAFSRMNGCGPEWKLAILGEGPRRKELEDQIAAANLTDRVALPGNVTEPAIYYLRASIFAMASAFEGVPNALLEAMAHGLPSIVPDNLPGALEYVENGVTGLVYQSGDVNGLAKCLEELTRDHLLRERLGRAARERVKPLSIENVAQKWEDLLFPSEAPARLGERA
jgi:GalNAc-alpha-(1->4)-GalNAc-alpha-(1->3)-diNAcBac-PP-undecaprenol alpha-1,4-N-acetyl-D-galactosaminyltransferase